MGPLLAFASPRHEAAFQAHFTAHQLRSDARSFCQGAPLCVLAALRMLLAGHPLAGGVSLLQAAWFALLAAAVLRQHPLYVRRHSALLSAFHCSHFLLSWLYAPSFWPSGFGGLLWYWLRELSLGLVPWTTLLAVSIPLPLKHGV